jgi:hypothetical protein
MNFSNGYVTITTNGQDSVLDSFWFIQRGESEPRKGLLLGSHDTHWLVLFDSPGTWPSLLHLPKATTCSGRTKEEAQEAFSNRGFQ